MSNHSAPPAGPFSVPAFHTWFPRRLQPWVYLLFIVGFQLTSGRYLGALDAMMGSESLMREDYLMCLYCNMAGMGLWFPMLFRMKFRFTNKTLLTVSAAGLAVCNFLSMQTTVLPLLWTLSFLEGIFKIQGTFECFSTIQLWMTPKRDFTIFFPILHIFVVGLISVGAWMGAWMSEWGDWRLMHWAAIGFMVFILLVLHVCTRHFRFMPKFPLVGIDWTGWLLWNALSLEIAALFCYGDFLNWWKGEQTWIIAGLTVVTLAMALWRMFTVRHPYISPAIFRIKYVVPIFVLIVAVEMIFASENVLEKVYLSEVMGYSELTAARLDWFVWGGVVTGCVFSLWWMNRMRFSYIRLAIVGIIAALCYLIGMYSILSPAIPRWMIAGPVFCRGFASATLSIMFLTSLQDSMTFQTFFQGLGIFQILHLIVGGCVGGAVFTRGLNYYVADGMARYGSWLDAVRFSSQPFNLGSFLGSDFVPMVMANAIKTLYGWTVFAALLLLLAFLLYDSPVRRRSKLMPATWREVGMAMRRPFLKKS